MLRQLHTTDLTNCLHRETAITSIDFTCRIYNRQCLLRWCQRLFPDRKQRGICLLVFGGKNKVELCRLNLSIFRNLKQADDPRRCRKRLSTRGKAPCPRKSFDFLGTPASALRGRASALKLPIFLLLSTALIMGHLHITSLQAGALQT